MTVWLKWILLFSVINLCFLSGQGQGPGNSGNTGNSGNAGSGSVVNTNSSTCISALSNWTAIGNCSATCGFEGLQTYQMNCCSMFVSTAAGCVTTNILTFTEQRKCVVPAVDGGWSNWTSWSTCPVTCGGTGNNQNRTRTCTNPAPSCNGTYCSGSSVEYQTCNANCCQVNGSWTAWGGWNACSVTCGGGSYSRTRSCTSPSSSCNETSCPGNSTETATCNSVCCPVNGSWTAWSLWNTCSQTCGGGTYSRTRSCTSPSPSCNGTTCSGNSTEASTCNSMCCPVNGVWSDWSAWTTCPVTCGGGSISRTRSCTNPSASCNGTDCQGNSTESTTCNSVCCPVDGVWSEWSAVGICSVTCGGGFQSWTRSCTNPSPSCNGISCTGSSSNTTSCNNVCCPVNGVWTDWGEWQTCPMTCGGTLNNQIRTRNCTNPASSCGGLDCTVSSGESDTNYTTCNTQCCAVNGGWASWAEWSACNATCGGGTRYRYRDCNNPVVSCGGVICPDCVGLLCSDTLQKDTDTSICNNFDCTSCGNNAIGYGTPSSHTSTTGTNTGFGILAENGFYTFACCGVVKSWELYASNAGELHLMVWQKSGLIYTLVGKNIYTVPSGAVNHTIKYTIREIDRLTVRTNDMIGWYAPAVEIIPYSVSSPLNFRMTSMGSTVEGITFHWSSVNFVNGSAYALLVYTDNNTSPFFTNVGRELDISDNETVGGNIYKIQYYNGDSRDAITWAFTTSNTNISYNTTTEMIYLKATPSVGTYTMTLSMTDPCGNTASGSLTIKVFNTPPRITSLPSFVNLHEDVKEGQLLHTLQVYDRQATDTIKCSLTTVTPSTGFFYIHIIPQTSDYGVYLQSNASFNYNNNNQYKLLISCEDGKNTAVTGFFFVYIQKNHPPRFLNLPASTELDASTTLIGDLVYTVQMEDDENNTLAFSLTTEPINGPFIIQNYGNIVTTANMSNIFTPAYNLKVSVNDGKTSVGTRTLSVRLKNINDVPVISNLPLPHPFLIEENSNIGTTLYHVRVRDLNSADTLVIIGDFHPNSGSSYLYLDTDGFLTMSSQLDYESIANTSFNILVTATDDRDTATTTISLTVTDENEVPVFNQSEYSVEQFESTQYTAFPSAGFSIYDPDVSESFTYWLDCANDTWRFSIGETTGKLTYAYNYDLDNLINTQFSCVVRVKDTGFNTCTASIIVKIKDANDNAPNFNQTQFAFFITPYENVGTIIGSVTAYDIDISEYGTFSYNLDLTSYGTLYVQIYDNGTLYVNKPLDSNFQCGDVMKFDLSAIDYGGLQTKVKVWIVFPEDNKTASTAILTTTMPKTFLLSSKNILWLTAVGILTLSINLGTLYYCWLCFDRARLIITKRNAKENTNIRKNITEAIEREKAKIKDTNENKVKDRFRNSVAPSSHRVPFKPNKKFKPTVNRTPIESEDNGNLDTDQIKSDRTSSPKP